MGLLSFIKRLFLGAASTRPAPARSDRFPARRSTRILTMQDLSQRLKMTEGEIAAISLKYTSFTIPKANGKPRTIHAPNSELKRVQGVLNKRVFGGVRLHDSAMGFVRGRSFVDHAARHADKAVVVRIDLKDFFPSIRREMVVELCRWLGWTPDAAERIADLCTLEGRLPQGAPTSPRISNILSIPMDRRLAGLAKANGGTYSRYADDLTFSFAEDDQKAIHRVLRGTQLTVWEAWDFQMEIHQKEKLHIRRAGYQRQEVTGLVVNDGPPRLPRETRRRLRAIRHRLAMGKPLTITPAQLAGWEALEKMIDSGTDEPGR